MTSGEARADVQVEVGSVPATGPLLEVRDLRVDFRHGGRSLRAVNGLSYALPVGRTLGVVGESGSGKTVSSRAIMGLLPATATVSGSVRFEGREMIGLSDKAMRRHRGADIAMVFQDPSRSLNCSSSCACPRPSSACTSTRTSSPAGCASAWSSPSRWPPSPSC